MSGKSDFLRFNDWHKERRSCYHNSKYMPKISSVSFGQYSVMHEVQIKTIVRFLSINDVYELNFETGKETVNKWKIKIYPTSIKRLTYNGEEYDFTFGLNLLRSDCESVMCWLYVDGNNLMDQPLTQGDVYTICNIKLPKSDRDIEINIVLKVFEEMLPTRSCYKELINTNVTEKNNDEQLLENKTQSTNVEQVIDNLEALKVKEFEEDTSALQLLFRTEFDAILQGDGKCYKVHREVLSKNSPAFAATIKIHENQTEPVVINLEDIESNAVLAMIQLLYLGKVLIDVKDVINQLLILACKYQIDKLKSFCEKKLNENICDENVLKNLSVACFYDLDRIKEICADYLKLHYTQVVNTEEWKQMEKDNKPLMSLIKFFMK